MANRPPTLRRKLLVWLVAPLLTLFATRAAYNYFLSRDLANDVYDSALYDLVKSLKSQIVFVNGKPTVNMSRSAYNILLYDQYDQVYFVIRDTSGKVIAGNENIPPPTHWDNSALDHLFFDGYVKNNKVRVVALRIPEPLDHENRFLLLEGAETLAKRKALANEIAINILMPQIFIIILAIVVIWFGVSKGLAPLQKLKMAVGKRSHLNLSPIEEKDVPGEARPLIDSFNDLMGRLQEALDSQNRFIADAAHQLRTPAAGIMAQIRLALRQNDPEMSKHCMEQVYVGAERINRLVNQLLALKRNDRGVDVMLQKSWIDLNHLVSETAMEWVPEAVKKHIDLGVEGENHAVKVLGDAGRLKEMINNLLDNAIRYTQATGHITVRVLKKNEIVAFVVEDNGPGIPPEERERVFDRFYRLLGNKTDGSGLGLAIVRDIARAHNAEVSIASNSAGKGTVVTVIFGQGDFQISKVE